MDLVPKPPHLRVRSAFKTHTDQYAVQYIECTALATTQPLPPKPSSSILRSFGTACALYQRTLRLLSLQKAHKLALAPMCCRVSRFGGESTCEGKMNLIFLLYGGERKGTGKIDDVRCAAEPHRTVSNGHDLSQTKSVWKWMRPTPIRSWGISRHRNHTSHPKPFRFLSR